MHVVTLYQGPMEAQREAMFSDVRGFIGLKGWVQVVTYVETAAWGHAQHIIGGGHRSLRYDLSVYQMVTNVLSIAGVEGAPVRELCRVYLATVGECVAAGKPVRPAILKGEVAEEALALVAMDRQRTHDTPQQHIN